MNPPGSRTARIQKIRDGNARLEDDVLAVEEPLEIRVGRADERGVAPQSLSVTMRTPGNDFELAVGFLFAEGILRGPEDVHSVEYARDHVRGRSENVVDVILARGVAFDPSGARRNFTMSSACGICGKASIDAIRVSGVKPLPAGRPQVRSDLLPSLPERLREAQALFSATGGLHAAARFDSEGRLLSVREDVGRHNAVDKLVGESVLADRMPLHESLLAVSGRASFEILQKAAVAGIPFVIAVGAPSSLAVDLAREYGMTLVGFVRDHGFNVYCGDDRIAPAIKARSAA